MLSLTVALQSGTSFQTFPSDQRGKSTYAVPGNLKYAVPSCKQIKKSLHFRSQMFLSDYVSGKQFECADMLTIASV